MTAPRCGTCRYWAPGAQGNPEFGNCQRIPAADDARPDIGQTLAFSDSTEGIGGAWLQTRAEFGCVLHEPALAAAPASPCRCPHVRPSAAIPEGVRCCALARCCCKPSGDTAGYEGTDLFWALRSGDTAGTAAQTGRAVFTLPTYGMPCCGHRVVEHGSESKATSSSRDCRCCRDGERLADALLLMADAAPGQSERQP